MSSPFHHRPQVHAEPIALASGDIEAVHPHQVPGFPPRPARPTAAPAAAAKLTRIPVPSPSLAPVAMNAAVRGRADSSAQLRASTETVTVRSRPSMRMGFSLVLAAVVLGGALGITTGAKPAAAYQPSGESAAAAHPFVDDALPPPVAKVADVAPAEPKVEAKVDSSDTKDAKADEDAKDTSKASGAKKKRAVAFVGKAVAPAAPAAPRSAKAAEKDDDDDYRVASADSDARPAKASKKAPAKAAPADDDDAPAPAPKPKSKPRASDDAVNVLKAAMGATENTL